MEKLPMKLKIAINYLKNLKKPKLHIDEDIFLNIEGRSLYCIANFMNKLK